MKPLRSILSHPDISGFTVFQRTVVYVLAFLVFMLLPVYFLLTLIPQHYYKIFFLST